MPTQEAPVDKVTSVLVKDTEKIFSLTSEVEALQLGVTQENQELLVTCISQNLGFAGGNPVAASLIYKCLLHWRSFELEETNIFDRIIQTIASDIEVRADSFLLHYNNQVLAYWLSNSAMLLKLLQHTFTSAAIPASRGCMGGGVVSSLDRQMQVEAKYPATLFKQQLIGFLEKMYVMIRDNLKIEVFSLLRLSKQVAQENNVPQQDLIGHWESIVERLSSYLNLMKANNTPPFLVSKLITQIFFFINLQLLNSILLSDDCCYFVNGEYVETGLAKLKNWCIEATDENAGSAWDELSHIRQAAGFLQAIIQKQEMTLDKITRELCPVLSIRQLYRISAMYFDDIYDMSSVSSDVISSMMIRLIDDLTDGVRSDFLLEDDLSIPFTVEDLSKSTEQGDVNDIDTLALIHENPSFSFLLTCGEGSSS
ncbi:PREDICTED: myosin-17-like [Brassica oleracea var. oleracea]|uniref:myosin-17-like n=1 Tax=Brassica oleracea var. oleracea TaxID=109376 RepID=UPI0006A7093C|nr:PREDICTED: myosin-17-like [Brassica oleracea var. oleracea]